MKYFFLPAFFPLLVIGCSSSGDDNSTTKGSGGATQPASGGSNSGSGGDSSSGSGGSDSSSGGNDGGGGSHSSGGMGGDASTGGDTGSGGSDPGPDLDACFADLREAVGSFQDATKTSPDGEYRVRLALETGDGFGTSGTRAWYAFRLGIETPNGTICVTDELALKDGYTGSHHNCDDVLEVTVGALRYVIENPDTASDYIDPTTWRRPGTLTIYDGDAQVGETIRLDTVSCNASNDGDNLCRSGGPC